MREEGWGERGKTFPFPFLFCAYTEATQGVESFVSLLAAAEEAGEVVFCAEMLNLVGIAKTRYSLTSYSFFCTMLSSSCIQKIVVVTSCNH